MFGLAVLTQKRFSPEPQTLNRYLNTKSRQNNGPKPYRAIRLHTFGVQVGFTVMRFSMKARAVLPQGIRSQRKTKQTPARRESLRRRLRQGLCLTGFSLHRVHGGNYILSISQHAVPAL